MRKIKWIKKTTTFLNTLYFLVKKIDGNIYNNNIFNNKVKIANVLNVLLLFFSLFDLWS